MLSLDFSQPILFLAAVIITFAIITFRYFIISGAFFFLFHNLSIIKNPNRKIIKKEYKREQFKKEVKYSLATSLIFAVAGALSLVMWQKGHTKVYDQITEYGWIFYILSLPLYMILHETYYYFVHRWMHNKKVFPRVHKVHHDSLIPSPWTSFSFHPIEAGLQAVILPLLLLVIPLHTSLILIYLTIMTFSSVVNHLAVEIYPERFNKNFLGKWLIGASHHALHHSQFKYNYGLYFTFWDKVLKTESPEFNSFFSKNTSTK